MAQALLEANERAGKELFEIILISKMNLRESFFIFYAIEKYDLSIQKAIFTGGESPMKYVGELDVDLLISSNIEDVQAATALNIPSAYMLAEQRSYETNRIPVRFAFDIDSVILSDEAEIAFLDSGFSSFFSNEQSKKDIPIEAGLFAPFLRKLILIKMENKGLIRIALCSVY